MFTVEIYLAHCIKSLKICMVINYCVKFVKTLPDFGDTRRSAITCSMF